MRFQLAAVAAATSGELLGDDVSVDGVSIDSRSVTPGALFVPIVAERDGHDFIDAAIDGGAAAHLTTLPRSVYPAVRVEDTTTALQRLGAAARERVHGDVVGITGSVGKTTTKDLLAAVLATAKRCHASYRSFNNELGVPVTLLEAPDDVEVVVTEMGARGLGHIAALCEVARPTVGIVLNVGAAHTELFGDLEVVARAKGELAEAIGPQGTVVLNAGDPLVSAMRVRTDATVLTFGDQGDVRAEQVVVDDRLRPSFTLVSPWGAVDCALRSAGIHTVANATAAAAAALSLGVPLAGVAEGVGTADISPWRMEVVSLASGALVINDAYNANTMSMHAAIDALASLRARRKVAVVGIMAELGERHHSDHVSIGERLAEEGIEVISVGVPEYGGLLVDGVDGARAALGELGEDDAVLIKASRVAGLERLALSLA